MSNIVLYPGSGILEFNTGVAGQSVLDNSLTGASRFSFNSGEINLTNYATGNLNRFTIDGSQGRLFLIDDQLSGSLFSVNTIAGLPVVEAFSDNTITLGQYGRYDLVVTGNAVGIGALPDTGTQKLCVSLSGITPYVLPSNPLCVVGSGNTYVQVNIQNRATGNNASTDLIITANDGTDSTYYLDLGLNNVGYNQAAYGNVSGHDGYLYVNGGNLTVGTQTVGTVVEIHAGGTTDANQVAEFNSTGAWIKGTTTLSGNVRVIGNINSNTSYNASVALTGNQSITGTVDNNVSFAIKNDPNSWWTSGTRRLTPNVSGYYNVDYQAAWAQGTTGVGNQNNIQILKNLNTVSISQQPINNSTINTFLKTFAIVNMNGSSDYLTFSAYSSNNPQSLIGDSLGVYTKVDIFKIN